jgi:hypothetical protein
VAKDSSLKKISFYVEIVIALWATLYLKRLNASKLVIKTEFRIPKDPLPIFFAFAWEWRQSVVPPFIALGQSHGMVQPFSAILVI